MKESQLLADARAVRDLLTKDKWTQGSYHKHGKFCMVGGAKEVILFDRYRGVQRDFVDRAERKNRLVALWGGVIARVFHFGEIGLPHEARVLRFNDYHHYEDVKRVLDLSVEDAEERLEIFLRENIS